jgi:hypothetical protein
VAAVQYSVLQERIPLLQSFSDITRERNQGESCLELGGKKGINGVSRWR